MPLFHSHLTLKKFFFASSKNKFCPQFIFYYLFKTICPHLKNLPPFLSNYMDPWPIPLFIVREHSLQLCLVINLSWGYWVTTKKLGLIGTTLLTFMSYRLNINVVKNYKINTPHYQRNINCWLNKNIKLFFM